MTTETPTPPPPAPVPTPRIDPSVYEKALRGVVQILSLRAILLLALLGAFVLALRAMNEQTTMALGVLVVYCVCAIFPVAYLEIKRHLS